MPSAQEGEARLSSSLDWSDYGDIQGRHVGQGLPVDGLDDTPPRHDESESLGV